MATLDSRLSCKRALRPTGSTCLINYSLGNVVSIRHLKIGERVQISHFTPTLPLVGRRRSPGIGRHTILNVLSSGALSRAKNFVALQGIFRPPPPVIWRKNRILFSTFFSPVGPFVVERRARFQRQLIESTGNVCGMWLPPRSLWAPHDSTAEVFVLPTKTHMPIVFDRAINIVRPHFTSWDCYSWPRHQDQKSAARDS